MDISGYHSRSTPSLMQTTMSPSHDAKRRRGGRQLSLGLKALLLLLLLGLAWAGIRRAGHKEAAAKGSVADSGVHNKQGVGGGKAGSGGGDASETKADELARSRAERIMRLLPSYRGVGKAETWPFFGNANRLLLASHGRLMWYRYDTDEVKVIHEKEGLYYGVFPGAERGMLGEPTSLWVVSAPFDRKKGDTQHATKGSRECLLHLDLESGRELGRVQLPSTFTHDVVRRRDRVYVADTGEGKVLELSFPGMQLERELPLFSPKEHVNTLAPASDGKLWAVLHSLGNSSAVEVDLKTGQELRRLPGVGSMSHGLVFWQHGFLTLDSAGGALVHVNTQDGASKTLWQLGEPGRFLKGLAVVDEIAFFGISPSMPQSRRADPTLNCELAAYDLQQHVLLWRRQLPTRGLLNIVAAPHLTVESTTYAVATRPQISYRDKPAFQAALEAAQKWVLQQEREAQGAAATQVVQQQEQQAAEAKRQQAGQAAPDEQQQAGVKDEGQQGQEQAQQGQQGQQAQQDHEQAQQAQEEEQLAQVQAGKLQQQEQQQQGQASEQATEQGDQHPLHTEQQQGEYAEQAQQQDGQQEQQQRGGAGGVVQEGGNMVRALSEMEPLPAEDPLAKYPPQLDPVRWSSGLPRLLLSAKGEEAGLGAGAQLRLLHFDTQPLKERLAELKDEEWEEPAQRATNAWFTGREKNLDKFKPGAPSIMLVFSDHEGSQVYRFPWYDKFKDLIEPLLLQVLGPADVGNVMRLQLARMSPQGGIKRHSDSGGYAASGHRIHLVIQSNAAVSFQVCDSPAHAGQEGVEEGADPPCVPLHVEEGLAFELNNRLAHTVQNDGNQARIHLVVDVAETPRQQRHLRVGEVCQYAGRRVVCVPRPLAELAQEEVAGHETDQLR